METISEYIDFSDNRQLWEEASHMTGLGQSILEEGIERGIEQGIERGRDYGMNIILQMNQHLMEEKRK